MSRIELEDRHGFGEALRGWRERRGLSQMELGLEAEVSSRHISFLETGRARPSREMVLRLCLSMDLPLRERNDLLLSAGFAPHYAERPLGDEQLVEARRALGLILEAHEPYPAFVLDRQWRIVLWNRTQEILLAGQTPPGGSPADLNALDLVFRPGMGRESFINWEDVAQAVLRRLRRQLSRVGSGDPLHATWRRIFEMPGVRELDRAGNLEGPPPILVPIRIRDGKLVHSWFSTLATFGATGDVTLEELVVESFFPADEATRRFILQAAAGRSAERPGGGRSSRSGATKRKRRR